MKNLKHKQICTILSLLLCAGALPLQSLPVFAVSAEPDAGEWIKSGTEYWYRYPDGTWPAAKWEFIEGKWYHFSSGGWMQRGWLKDNNIWYYRAKRS